MAEQRVTRSARARAARIANQLTTAGRTRRTQEEIDADNAEDEAIAINSRKMNNGLREALQDMVNKYQPEVIEPAAKIHKQEVEAMNQRIKNSIHPAVPKTLIGSHDWSQEDEDSVLAQWEAEKQYWVNVHDIGRYLNLWKICLQYGKCTPWDIVGVNTKLTFELSPRGDMGEEDEETNHTWSAPFLLYFMQLVCHPAWSASKASSRAVLLATVIQYAVILRTNDQRVWDLKNLADEFFVLFRDLCLQRCPCLISDIHKEVRERMAAAGKVMVPVISHVLQSLERVVKVPDEALVTSNAEPYFVTTQDLANLIKALDHTVDPNTGINMFMPVAVTYASAKAAQGARGLPSERQLAEYHKLALLEEMRRRVRASRQSPPRGNSHEPSDQHRDAGHGGNQDGDRYSDFDTGGSFGGDFGSNHDGDPEPLVDPDSDSIDEARTADATNEPQWPWTATETRQSASQRLFMQGIQVRKYCTEIRKL